MRLKYNKIKSWTDLASPHLWMKSGTHKMRFQPESTLDNLVLGFQLIPKNGTDSPEY